MFVYQCLSQELKKVRHVSHQAETRVKLKKVIETLGNMEIT